MNNKTIPSRQTGQNRTQRLLSIDALRGFDMFWILGAEGIFVAIHAITGWSFLLVAARQMQHSPWHGFTAYDLIFPLFIFLSGVSLGLSARAINSYERHKRTEKYRHAILRLLVLLTLGVIYNHGWGSGAPVAFDQIRFASVLGRIGIAWFVATLLVWHVSPRTQLWVIIGILLGYWWLLAMVTIGGFGGGDYRAEHALNAWFDQHWLPGATYQQLPIDPEGILSNIPAIANALIGAVVGRWMKQHQQCPGALVVQLVLGGSFMLLCGALWATVFPLNKSLWTSSFVLVSCGFSVWLLALFYLLVEVLKLSKFANFFAVIGMNSLVIYVSSSLVDWQFTASSVFGGMIAFASIPWQPLLLLCANLVVQWSILYWLYQRKIFIKV